MLKEFISRAVNSLMSTDRPFDMDLLPSNATLEQMVQFFYNANDFEAYNSDIIYTDNVTVVTRPKVGFLFAPGALFAASALADATTDSTLYSRFNVKVLENIIDENGYIDGVNTDTTLTYTAATFKHKVAGYCIKIDNNNRDYAAGTLNIEIDNGITFSVRLNDKSKPGYVFIFSHTLMQNTSYASSSLSNGGVTAVTLTGSNSTDVDYILKTTASPSRVVLTGKNVAVNFTWAFLNSETTSAINALVAKRGALEKGKYRPVFPAEAADLFLRNAFNV